MAACAELFSENVSIKMFADDIKIYMEVDSNSHTATFQEGIDSVADWARKWQLKLSVNKCQHMRISLRKTVSSSDYLLDGSVLPTVLSCKDLGVHVDSTLCFTTHINNVVTRAKQRACQILRCFHSKDPVTLSKAFVVYVRPLVEYCSPVWSPCTVTAINKLESVQRMFTKRLAGLSSVPYDNRLNALGLVRLEVRRIYADLVMCYKIVHVANS
jgi:hypothetical protein